MTRDEEEFWNHGFGVWEDRPRDPAWLNQITTESRRGEYIRAECCHDAVRFVCELPRWRPGAAGKPVELPSVRLRLCAFHASVLITSDSTATAHPIKENQ